MSKQEGKDYLVFETKTILDIRAITTFGLHAKPNTKSPIGYFGTGLKMAIAVLCRLGIPVEVHIGTAQYAFRADPIMFRSKEFQLITMGRKRSLAALWDTHEMPFTTELGKNWKLWMAFRELEANTRDEGGHTYWVNPGAYIHPSLTPTEGRTRIILHSTPELREVFNERHTTFLRGGLVERGSNPEIQIMNGESKYIYYRGMRVLDLEKPSAFTYNILGGPWCDLTEDRTLKYGYMVPVQIAQFLAQSTDKELIHRLLSVNDTHYEHELPIDRVTDPSPEFLDIVKNRVANEKPPKEPKYSSTPSWRYAPLVTSPRISSFIELNTPKVPEVIKYADWHTFDADGQQVPVPQDIADHIDGLMTAIQEEGLDYSTEQVCARLLIEDRARRLNSTDKDAGVKDDYIF